MRTSSVARSATRPLFNATIASTTARAGPSSTSTLITSAPSSSKTLPGGQASASTLRSLISLHHSSATFMRDPSEMPNAFHWAFSKYSPTFRTYSEYRDAALAMAAQRGVGGIEVLAERGATTDSRGQRRSSDEDLRHAAMSKAERPRETFRVKPVLFTTRPIRTEGLTEREARVKEAMFGTYERGTSIAPGLEGVLDILDARGMTVAESAKEWRERDSFGDKDGEGTEDGL